MARSPAEDAASIQKNLDGSDAYPVGLRRSLGVVAMIWERDECQRCCDAVLASL